MTSVRETWGLACPHCHGDEDLQIICELWLDVWPDGTTVDGNCDHIWDERSECRCRACNIYGTVREFTVSEGGQP